LLSKSLSKQGSLLYLYPTSGRNLGNVLSASDDLGNIQILFLLILPCNNCEMI